jgi:hypothetical protein
VVEAIWNRGCSEQKQKRAKRLTIPALKVQLSRHPYSCIQFINIAKSFEYCIGFRPPLAIKKRRLPMHKRTRNKRKYTILIIMKCSKRMILPRRVDVVWPVLDMACFAVYVVDFVFSQTGCKQSQEKTKHSTLKKDFSQKTLNPPFLYRQSGYRLSIFSCIHQSFQELRMVWATKFGV